MKTLCSGIAGFLRDQEETDRTKGIHTGEANINTSLAKETQFK